MIIVHPGDAIEDGIGFEGESRHQVIDFGRTNALGMAAEIVERFATHDTVIIHRQSSLDTFMRADFAQFRQAEQDILPYTKACIKASEIGTVLYGDDLEAIGQWISAALWVDQRPGIFMTGAYSDAEHGCITIIRKLLQRAGAREITVSQHAPTDNSNHAPRWVPSKVDCSNENLIRSE